MRRHLWVVAALAAVALMATGLNRGEWKVVFRHATALCTACIGLTEASSERAEDRPDGAVPAEATLRA